MNARLASNADQHEIEFLWALHWDVQMTRERGMCTRKEAKNAELGIFDRLFEVAAAAAVIAPPTRPTRAKPNR